ncbi:MAG: DNA-binding protein [Zoogloeaceae bacterium]|jgi:gp16 family phage-associated protein|nr:DNA-binding protein [Zoogloeaceae bacterium]
MAAKTLSTPAEVRARFIHQGLSQAEWARKHGVSKVLLCNILHGKRKCLREESHRIAVLLGLKDGEIFLPETL